MVQGYSDYESSFAKMKKRDWVLPNGNVQVKQMQAALGHGNTTLHNSEPRTEAICLLFVVYQEKYRHWVVRQGGLYYDPLPRYRRPRKSISYKVTRAISLVQS